jgi:uncharacterized GH25 family protein
VAAAVIAVFGARLAAHDFWIQPSSFTPAANSVVQIKLRVGDDFPGDPVARNAARIESFFVHGPDGRHPVAGQQGADPAGRLRVTSPGTYLIGYRGRPSPVNLAARAFEQYLKEEGLENISELRAQKKQSGMPGRERFSRSVKSLLHVGGAPPEGHDIALGLMLEIMPDVHPSQLPADGRMGFRVLYDGRPLEGAMVVAIPQAGADRAKSERRRSRTAADGRVELPLGPGAWTLKAVHMVPAAAGSGADWDSIWTSFTFHAGAAK